MSLFITVISVHGSYNVICEANLNFDTSCKSLKVTKSLDGILDEGGGRQQAG